MAMGQNDQAQRVSPFALVGARKHARGSNQLVWNAFFQLGPWPVGPSHSQFIPNFVCQLKSAHNKLSEIRCVHNQISKHNKLFYLHV